MRRGNPGIQRAIRTGAFLAGCCLLQSKVCAQSFDCSKATTPVEHAICDNRSLRELDEALDRDLKTALAAAPDRRQLLLADQRRWLAYRDRRCRDESPLDGCLTPLYKARVAHLRASVSASAAICRKVADGYRPQDGVLVNEQPPQYSSGESFPFNDDAVSQLQESAAAHEPPFVISQELMDALKNLADETGTIGTLAKMPGMDLYSMTHEQGSAHCVTSQFFAVENGIARPIGQPDIFEAFPGASCGALRGFARIDGIPALVQSAYDDRSPKMSETKVIVTWDDKLSSSGCALTFSYAPKFGPATYYRAKEVCEGPLCDGLRAAARELVEAVQKSPKRTRERLQSQLTEAQRAEYGAAVERLIQERGDSNAEDPADITDFVPMRLPYVYGGRVYAVSLGHFKPYGDVFADWSVIFESTADGKLAHAATFAVGMEKGEVEDISISLEMWP